MRAQLINMFDNEEMGDYRDDWFKDGDFWTHFQPKWAIKRYRLSEPAVERSDLGFNTADKLVRDHDLSPWAKKSLLACFIMLVTGYRWPRRMIDPSDAPSHILWRLSNLAEWLYLISWVLYRPRNSMTRDPHYAFWAAAAMHGDWRKIELTPIPPGHFRPNGYFCWKFLVTGDERYLKLYRTFEKATLSKKDFVNRLGELREVAIQHKLATLPSGPSR